MLALWHVLVVRSASAAANPSNWHQRSAFPGHVSAAGTIAPDDPKGCARNPSTNSNNASGSNGDDKSNSPAGTGTNPGSTVPHWRRLVPIGQSAAGMDPFPLGKHNHYLSLHRFSPRSYHFLTQICQTPFHSSTVKTLSLPARPFFAGIHCASQFLIFPGKLFTCTLSPSHLAWRRDSRAFRTPATASTVLGELARASLLGLGKPRARKIANGNRTTAVSKQ